MDQIFIGQGVGYLGNAATNVSYPLTTICLAIALLIGIIYAIVIEIFMGPLLTAFGATAEIMPYAETYSRIVAIGMPFLIVTNGMSNSLNQVAITFVQIVLNNSLTYYGAMSAYGKESLRTLSLRYIL